MQNENLKVRGWRDYELIDSGDNRKLERFGKYILIRPETQALWQPSQPAAWKRANAEFRFTEGKGAWMNKKSVPEEWEMQWNEARFVLRLTGFKHIGVFPEQAANWEWIAEQVMHAGRVRHAPPKVLNLFGYTGIASIVAAKAGAHVTHVDASRQSNEWAKENARLSEVPAESIRFLFDDALKFAEREVRRGVFYDGIILDPPAFGRGAKGEVWHIEEHLSRLLSAVAKLLAAKPGTFFLLNGYAAGYSPRSFLQAVTNVFGDVPTRQMRPMSGVEFGELELAGLGDVERVVPSGIYVRFSK